MSSDTDEDEDIYDDSGNDSDYVDDWTDGIAEFLGDDPDEF